MKRGKVEGRGKSKRRRGGEKKSEWVEMKAVRDERVRW